MATLKEHWFAFLLGVIVLFVVLAHLPKNNTTEAFTDFSEKRSIIPDISELTNSEADDLIRYGKLLIDSTSKFFGPHGTIAAITNGMDCENCHRESGTKLYTNNFLVVAATYPKYRERSGRVESVEFRVNDCMQRSLNGEPIDSLSKEMKAMVAYIKWTGKNVKDSKTEGAGNKELPFISRAADPAKGKIIYVSKCQKCHGQNGDGTMMIDKTEYIYPPLWGEHSYAESAGMYRLSKAASFIKYNMPFGATYEQPELSDEEAWDVAAFINSQPHPKKIFAYDWPVISTKPVDLPFGPYNDGFTEKQHKDGPFAPIKKAKDLAVKNKPTSYPAKQ